MNKLELENGDLFFGETDAEGNFIKGKLLVTSFLDIY